MQCKRGLGNRVVSDDEKSFFILCEIDENPIFKGR